MRVSEVITSERSTHTFSFFAFSIVRVQSLFPYESRMLLTNLSLPSANRDPAGGASGLSLYFPLRRPKFSGEKVVSPMPKREYKR